jgi:transcriptional regulator with XRE-family HTH domain
MKGQYRELAYYLRDLRKRCDLGQKDASRVSERTFRRYESGERRPSREDLIRILVDNFNVIDRPTIERALRLAKYSGLSAQEIVFHNIKNNPKSKTMNTPLRRPQSVRWGPTDGREPGIICYYDSSESEFVPWAELKPQIESRLLNQIAFHLPADCQVILDSYRNRPNWLVRIVDSRKNNLGYVWFGTDPDSNWAFDGLIRAGNDTYIVWQVFQRHSDGSYTRVRTQKPRVRD